MTHSNCEAAAPVAALSHNAILAARNSRHVWFYADNGSTATEVALKMTFHYSLNRGQGGKSQFLTLNNSYRGEDLGALSVGAGAP